MKNLSSNWPALLTALALAACSHSDPFPTDPSLEDKPLNGIEPIRLTYSSEDDGFPAVSLDADWLSYRFERGRPDRDFCAGAIPAAGGQRVAEICAWESNDLTRSDDFRSLVLLGGDRWAFTWHASGTGNQAPGEGGLYVGPRNRPQEATKVLDLLAIPPGASGSWWYLIDPVLSGDNELLTLAAGAFIGQTIAFGPVDTVYQGVEIARIDLSTNPASVTSVVAAPNAVAWMLDRDAGLIYFQRRYYSAPPGSGPTAIVADTVFRVPVAGGVPTAIFGAPPLDPGLIASGMNGFTVLEGRLLVSLYTTRPVPPSPGTPNPPPETESAILEVHADGSQARMYELSSRTGDRWGRLAVRAGTTQIIAEARIGNSKDLYLLEVGS